LLAQVLIGMPASAWISVGIRSGRNLGLARPTATTLSGRSVDWSPNPDLRKRG